MHKEFASKSMTQSFLKNPVYHHNSPPANSQSYYYSRPNTNYINISPDRMNQSFVAPSTNMRAQNVRVEQVPVKQLDPIRSCSQLQQKENTRMNNKQEETFSPLRLMQQRILEVQKKIQKIQKQEKKGEMITKHIEQVMQLQLKDIKFNEELQERLNILEEMMKHIKATKLDRKELETGHYSNTNNQGLQNEIQELWKQQEANRAQLKENKQRLHRLVNKIETSIVAIGEKYEEFIESNIIKSIEHVNKLTYHYHEEIESFKSDYMRFKEKIQAISTQRHSNEKIKEAPPSLKMMEISIPHLKVIQSITILNEKKGQYGAYSNKQIAKEIRSMSGMASYKNNLLNSLYDSIDKSTEKSTQSSCAEILLEKVIYKIDREYYLLDQNEQYLIDASNNRVRLTSEHIKILEENGLLQ